MGRKDFNMNELVEVFHQWHTERSISRIKRSVGIYRKTIRKYIGLAGGMDYQGTWGFSHISIILSRRVRYSET